MQKLLHSVITIDTPPAKNSTLPLIYAMCLSPAVYKLSNCPIGMLDLKNTLTLLRSIGVRAIINREELRIQAVRLECDDIDEDFVSKTRYSSLLLGVLGARYGFGVVPLPGGCSLNRKLDVHIDGMRALGFSVRESPSKITFERISPGASTYHLRVPSVGATLNLIFLACGGSIEVKLSNCAQEPEILNTINFLNTHGAKIVNNGDGDVNVSPSPSLKGGAWAPIPDRIVAGTYLLASIILRRKIHIRNFIVEHHRALLKILDNANVKYDLQSEINELMISGENQSPQAFSAKAEPFPGFPSDLQPILAAFSTCCTGTSKISDIVYGDRFQYINELASLGARIERTGDGICIFGNSHTALNNYTFTCMDIRGSMACLIYSLRKHGKAVIRNPSIINRGYSNIEEFANVFGFEVTKNENVNEAAGIDGIELVQDQIAMRKIYSST
ncbi:hypothetical protein ACK32A_02305 [Aeromonas enteropelogenes]|uniref:hypothetical protein n=1 Tax=Aeromonas enteropelogenes TaxID=29489 RepID=UPI00398A1229